MSVICPTLTAAGIDEYKEQIARLEPFVERLHIDFADGVLAPSVLVNVIQAWWPDGVIADFHLMLQWPTEHIETIVSLQPNLAIVHAEADGDLLGMAQHLKRCGIKAGVALLPGTLVHDCEELIAAVDHALLFSGDLGHFGGMADMKLLNKVPEVLQINPGCEIGWDGGANADNARQLMHGGVDVINVGGAIHKASDPTDAYAKLNAAIT